MGSDETIPTCLTDKAHAPDEIFDKLTHYTGCIEISERAAFLTLKHEVWRWEWKASLDKAREDQTQEDPEVFAQQDVERKLQAFASSIYGQYYRTRIIRSAIGQEKPRTRRNTSRSPDGADTVAPELEDPSSSEESTAGMKDLNRKYRKFTEPKDTSHLVKCVETSLRKWRSSKIYRDGIVRVRKWRGDKDKVVNGPEIMAKEEDTLLLARMGGSKRGRANRAGLKDPEKQVYEVEKDLNAYLIQFKPESHVGDSPAPPTVGSTVSSYTWADATSTKVKGHFPNQRIQLEELLLDRDGDLLNTKGEDDWFKYFHIPCNNMDYVERIISKYFHEDRPKFHPYREPAVKSKSYMLLRHDYWRGQQHGGANGFVHARHLRPLCGIVSATDRVDLEHVPRNLVLFMPYLHWETDRNRARISRIIDEESEKQRQKDRYNEAKQKRKREKHRDALQWKDDDKKDMVKHSSDDDRFWKTEDEDADTENGENKEEQTPEASAPGGFATLMQRLNMPKPKPKKKEKKERALKLEFGKNGRLLTKSELGQYLIDVARLYEAMSSYRDQKLLEDYLHHNPPLHPRRTLDQSYYWTLKTTRSRDQDQVIYRSTTANPSLAHRLMDVEVTTAQNKRMRDALKDKEPKPLTSVFVEPVNALRDKLGHVEDGKAKCDKRMRQWTDHFKEHDKHGCEHCQSDIRKISRVVMVDQLWMWILDNRTIVTCFPRRYGVNKQDPSGVHKSIRQRLENARKNQIRSVFDLALIILDECSNTFFDRTKTRDRQLQVMDHFSEAIGTVTHKQTILYDGLWHWAEEASNMYRSKSRAADGTEFHAPLLDISHEGKLQKEIKDIIDELNMMIHIHKKQQEVMKRFVKSVEHIMDEGGDMREASPSADWDKNQKPSPPPLLIRKKTMSPPGSPSQGTAGTSEERSTRLKHEQFDWFRTQASDLLSEVMERIEELEGLRDSAQTTAQGVTDLLELKQQQASVVQAWQAVKQGEETVRQGRSIMMFTLVTILFLPLAFMSSVFGMNNNTFTPPEGAADQAPMELWTQIKWMVIVAIAVIVISVLIAFRGFSSMLRAMVWSAWIYSITWIIVTSRIYSLYLMLSDAVDSNEIVKKTEKKVQKLKDDVREVSQKSKRVKMLNKAKARRKEARQKAQEHVKEQQTSLPTQENGPGAGGEAARGAAGAAAQNGLPIANGPSAASQIPVLDPALGGREMTSAPQQPPPPRRDDNLERAPPPSHARTHDNQPTPPAMATSPLAAPQGQLPVPPNERSQSTVSAPASLASPATATGWKQSTIAPSGSTSGLLASGGGGGGDERPLLQVRTNTTSQGGASEATTPRGSHVSVGNIAEEEPASDLGDAS